MQFGQNKLRDERVGEADLCHTLGAVMLDQGAKSKFGERRSKNNAAMLAARLVGSAGNGDVGV